MNKPLSKRIYNLLYKTKKDFSQNASHRLMREEDMRCFAEIACSIYSNNSKKAEVQRKAEFLNSFAEKYIVPVFEDELIVGSQAFENGWKVYLSERQFENINFQSNNGHSVVDYGRVMKLGIKGLKESIETAEAVTEFQKRNKNTFKTSLNDFSKYISQYSDITGYLSSTC